PAPGFAEVAAHADIGAVGVGFHFLPDRAEFVVDHADHHILAEGIVGGGDNGGAVAEAAGGGRGGDRRLCVGLRLGIAVDIATVNLEAVADLVGQVEAHAGALRLRDEVEEFAGVAAALAGGENTGVGRYGTL